MTSSLLFLITAKPCVLANWVTLADIRSSKLKTTGTNLAWENGRHFATLQMVSPPNEVWETSAEIPYWWRVTTHIWVVLLIGRAAWEIWFNQPEALPRSGISMDFLRLFLRRHLAGKPVVASPSVGCFLRLGQTMKKWKVEHKCS